MKGESLQYLADAGMGLLFATLPFKEGKAPPEEFVWYCVAIGLVITAAMLALAVAKLLVAKALRERKSRTLCYVIASLSLFGMPYGTLLGVLTFLVLSRPSVAGMFGAN